MTKTKKPSPPAYCLHEEYNHAFPVPYQRTLANTIQRAGRGLFPAVHKLEGKRSPPLFVREEVMQYALRTFSRFYPENVEAVRVALGLPKIPKSQLSYPELMQNVSAMPRANPVKKKPRKVSQNG